MSTTTPTITAYLKTYCGWSQGVRAVLAKYGLPHEVKDIIKNPAFRWEMEQRSGQSMSPCVVVDGEMLADVSGEELENHLVEKGYITRSSSPVSAPTGSGCPSA